MTTAVSLLFISHVAPLKNIYFVSETLTPLLTAWEWGYGAINKHYLQFFSPSGYSQPLAASHTIPVFPY